MNLRPHGVLPPREFSMSGPVEGVCVSVDLVNSLVTFTIPSYSKDQKFGPAPFVGGRARPALVPLTHDTGVAGAGIITGYADITPVKGDRLLVIFASAGDGIERPWVIGWTEQR